MCLRKIPSNCAPSASSAPRVRCVAGVRLELDPLQAASLERVLEQQELRLDVRARPPGRPPQPRPADLDAPMLGRRQFEEPRRSDLAAVRDHRERDLVRRADSASSNQRSNVVQRIAMKRKIAGASAAAARSPSRWRSSSGSTRTMPPDERSRRGSSSSTRRRARAPQRLRPRGRRAHAAPRAARAPGPRAGGRARASGRARGRSPRASTARPRSRTAARGSAARAPAARRAPCGCSGGAATPRPRRTGPAASRSAKRSPSSPSSSAPTVWFSETDADAADSASSTCWIGRPVASASSSFVGSRPSSTSSRRAARDSFCCRSTTCTGTRIVRAWFATARCTDWRIHQVAYVENL